MAVLEVEDLCGECKVTIFPDAYEHIKPVLKEDEIYQIRGRVSVKQGEIPSIICTSMKPISQVITKRIIITAKNAYQCRDIIKYIGGLKVFGKNPIYLQNGRARFLLPRELWVDIDLFFRYLDRNLILQDQIYIKEW
jgi:DNA polymerase-3 subunit alpha